MHKIKHITWKAPLSLDERICLDLTEWYNDGHYYGEITAAKELDGVIHHTNGNHSFSVKGLPGHFTGKREADTVVVMLNPGQNISDADKRETIDNEIKKLNIDTSSLSSFIDSYKDGKANYGNHSKGDSFDVKQARFLKPWKNSGINFPNGFPQDPNTYEEAKRKMLLDKLQLELVPYCSKEFVTNPKCLEQLLPFVETLFKEIFYRKREYVIFCGNVFEKLFTLYGEQHPNSVKLLRKKGPFCKSVNNKTVIEAIQIRGRKIKPSCTIYTISYNGKIQHFLIANTFAYRGLSGCNMDKYGELCYNEYANYCIKQNAYFCDSCMEKGNSNRITKEE